ncbi:MAG: Nramp family divalent metal transporter [Gemmatimonadaceae bacterium]|nr:Nramp family divalent metal transporter [Gemmatimonadaceae bacterium]
MLVPPRNVERREAERPEREYELTRSAKLKSFVRELGPGLVTGAADDDPSGIATYSQAGAAFGYGLLWTALITLPLMTAVQLMCARIGLVTRHGLAAVLREHYSRWLLWFACLLLFTANTINIAADLGGMAAAARMLSGFPAVWFVPAFTLLILVLLIFGSYRSMTRVFKWLTLVLFAYVIAGFVANPDWDTVLGEVIRPRIVFSRDYLLTFVAILGTTISPYLFFWQAAQNAEQEEYIEKKIEGRPRRALQRELRASQRDVVTGMFISNLIMFFIVLTAGATLHQAGQTDIQTAEQAAAALRPLAGNAAYLLFTLGLVGTGMLAVPVLAGSAAYALAEAGAWNRGMSEKMHDARNFYGVIVVAMLIGMALNFAHLNAVKLLFWTAVINGLLAPPLIVILLFVCNNPRVMGEHRNGWKLNLFGILAAVLMTFAGLALAFSWLRSS